MNQEVAYRMGSKLEILQKFDKESRGRQFLRIRVDIEITKPLRRFIMLSNTTGKNDLWAQLSYERLPLFCYDCGIIGHSEIERTMERYY